MDSLGQTLLLTLVFSVGVCVLGTGVFAPYWASDVGYNYGLWNGCNSESGICTTNDVTDDSLLWIKIAACVALGFAFIALFLMFVPLCLVSRTGWQVATVGKWLGIAAGQIGIAVSTVAVWYFITYSLWGVVDWAFYLFLVGSFWIEILAGIGLCLRRPKYRRQDHEPYPPRRRPFDDFEDPLYAQPKRGQRPGEPRITSGSSWMYGDNYPAYSDPRNVDNYPTRGYRGNNYNDFEPPVQNNYYPFARTRPMAYHDNRSYWQGDLFPYY